MTKVRPEYGHRDSILGQLISLTWLQKRTDYKREEAEFPSLILTGKDASWLLGSHGDSLRSQSLLQNANRNENSNKTTQNRSLGNSFLKNHLFLSQFEAGPPSDLGQRSQIEQVRRSIDHFCGVKKFLLFGIRPRWIQYCKSKSNPQFHYLIDFPRAFKCRTLKCTIILNYSVEPRDIRWYDVIIFTNVYEWLTREMWEWAHGNRTQGQRWVMVTQESPLYVRGLRPPKKFGNTTYDWLDSYRQDSHFYHPYGWFRPFTSPKEWDLNITNFMSGKSKLIAWMASHCETEQWDRHRFVDDFSKKVEVDTYGKCGEKQVKWTKKERTYTAIFKKYKFYLSLENSCCDEYITEKFWRSLKLGVLPIVVGAPYEHYLRKAPPNSFIHVDMFNSMDELAAYIYKLDRDDVKYSEHFRWRSMGQLTSRPLVDHFLLPLTNKTHCSILSKYMRREMEIDQQEKLDYFSSFWHNSCSSCSTKSWMKAYMYDDHHSRQNHDIWA
ncbi:Alpha-(1,3)-fucosyltransferase 4 [Holothuria leucospilota]|uniref:Fucosyltransferase n=1 Tax=Holothuria leucospilota TaxID=206669 RepID=A0A9Q1HGB3_HOLLE|nr:Alpha-(1,3)-fucosyltransferase 4 [Holothuria leucospilota]